MKVLFVALLFSDVDAHATPIRRAFSSALPWGGACCRTGGAGGGGKRRGGGRGGAPGDRKLVVFRACPVKPGPAVFEVVLVSSCCEGRIISPRLFAHRLVCVYIVCRCSQHLCKITDLPTGVSVSQRDHTPLHLALRFRHLGICQYCRHEGVIWPDVDMIPPILA